MHDGFKPSIDERSNAYRTIGMFHSKTHDGLAFEVIGVVPALAGGTSVYRGFVTPAVGEIHLEPSSIFSTASGVTNMLYEGATFTGGTAVKIYNRDRNSPRESPVTVWKLVTPVELGTDVVDVLVAGVGGNPANDQGGRASGDLDNEIILKRNTSYVFEMKNIGTVTTDVYYSHTWYEEED